MNAAIITFIIIAWSGFFFFCGSAYWLHKGVDHLIEEDD